MKKFTLLLAAVGSVAVSACSTITSEPQVRDGSVRLENLRLKEPDNVTNVYLMCYKKRPTGWNEPKQYKAGQHELWVKAVVKSPSNGNKELVTRFNVNLAAGNSYTLSRKLDGDNISIWLQNSNTGEVVSDVISAELKMALTYDDNVSQKQCKSSTI
jgi:hypothetical protein